MTPRASRDAVEQISEGEYRVRLTASPVKGAANERLIEVLSKHFRVAKSLIGIVGGKTARTKIVDITK